MSRWLRLIVFLYLLSIVCANLLVKYFGAYGLWFSSFFLIPFDFVTRCLLHEKWTGLKLILRLFAITTIACALTYALNTDAKFIAIASISGFTSAQLVAGIFYQFSKKRSWFFKVNMSDLVAIIADSIVFQLVAFGHDDWTVTSGQVAIKFTGGLLWYYIIFKRFKLQDKL